MPRPKTRHANNRSTAMTPSFSTASSAAADDFGGLSLASQSSPLSSRHSSASPSPTPQSSTGSSLGRPRGDSTSSQNGPKRRERQTRLQEHLKTVKPGTSHVQKSKYSLGQVASSSSASKTLPMRMSEPSTEEEEQSPSKRPRRKAAQKVVMQELEAYSDSDAQKDGDDDDDAMEDGDAEEMDEEFAEDDPAPSVKKGARKSRARKAPVPVKAPREREISSLSTVSAGIDVEGMDEDEVQNRLHQETNELMERLAQHG